MFAAATTLLVKRVTALPGDPVPHQARRAIGAETVPPGHFVAIGDAPHSVDSRWFGLVPMDRVRGVVIADLKVAR